MSIIMVNVKYRSPYIAILMKSKKSLELVSSLQYWAKNMLEMFFIQQ